MSTNLKFSNYNMLTILYFCNFELASGNYVLCVQTVLCIYREALHHDEGHSKARLSLAELHLLKGELEACEHECVTLLRTDPGNEEATVVCSQVLACFNWRGCLVEVLVKDLLLVLSWQHFCH